VCPRCCSNTQKKLVVVALFSLSLLQPPWHPSTLDPRPLKRGCCAAAWLEDEAGQIQLDATDGKVSLKPMGGRNKKRKKKERVIIVTSTIQEVDEEDNAVDNGNETTAATTAITRTRGRADGKDNEETPHTDKNNKNAPCQREGNAQSVTWAIRLITGLFSRFFACFSDPPSKAVFRHDQSKKSPALYNMICNYLLLILYFDTLLSCINRTPNSITRAVMLCDENSSKPRGFLIWANFCSEYP
jgi:hypothetical protein